MQQASCRLWAAFVLSFVLGCGDAAASKGPWEEYDKLVKKAETVGSHGFNLFGDEVNLQNGALSFRVTDVSLPGNNALPVEITRTFSTETIGGAMRGTLPSSNVLDAPLGDWELDLPHIGGVFALSTGWINPVAGKEAQRCTVANASESQAKFVRVGTVVFGPEEIWHGTRINIPGRGSRALLVRTASSPQPTAGGAYWITSDWTSVACLTGIVNGSGQGFLATTSDGTRYWFNWMAAANETQLTKQASQTYFHLERRRYALYATRVEDRFGNSVAYTYTNAADAPIRLSSIESSDGRIITVTPNASGQVGSVSAHGRTWSYGYAGGTTGVLTSVTLPDTSRWTIDLDGFRD